GLRRFTKRRTRRAESRQRIGLLEIRYGQPDRGVVTGLQRRRGLHRRLRRLAECAERNRRQEALGLQNQRRDQILTGRGRRSRLNWILRRTALLPFST